MHSAVFAIATCPSVSVSDAGIVPSGAKAGSWNRKSTPSDRSSFWQGMTRRKIRKRSPPKNVPNESGVGFSAIFDKYVTISRKRCILETKYYRTVIGSDRQTIDYIEWPLIRIPRSLYSLTSDISKTLRDRASYYWTLIESGMRFASVARVCQR